MYPAIIFARKKMLINLVKKRITETPIVVPVRGVA
jgi:hypothetical protein